MTNDLKGHFSYLKEDLALTHEEHSAMRAELELISKPAVLAPVLSPFLFFANGPMRFAGAFAILVLVCAGGGSVLAREALPGDALYSMKIQVNESLERSLARSPEARADVDIKHAEERLSEVELLAARGDAGTTDVEAVAADVAKKVASASLTANDLAESGDEAKADTIHARIASALLAHADILDAQAGSLSDEKESQHLRALSFAISATADETDESRDAEEVEDNPAVTAEVALDREEQVLRLIRQLRDGLESDGLTDETHDELLIELASIEADYGTTRELVASEEYEDAGATYEKLEQRAYRTLALLKSAKRINETTGKEVLITLENSTSSADARNAAPALMKAAATLAAPALENQAIATDVATSTEVLRKGSDNSGHTLEFRVRARSWNP